MAGVVWALPYTCSSTHMDSPTLCQHQYWHLCPHYRQPSAMYRPFIFCCRTPVFLHYSTVYTIHFSLYVTDSSHSMTYAGVSQRCRSYQCFHSCSRIKSDMSINRCSVQVCVCVCRCVCSWLSGPYKQIFTWDSPESFHRGRLRWVCICVSSAPLGAHGVGPVFVCLSACIHAVSGE